MAFKNLNDQRRRDAFLPFLSAANLIPGLCISFAIHRSVQSMLVEGRRIRPNDPDHSIYASWPSREFEKVMRIAHFLALLVAGLSAPGQDLFWFTDHDAITANAQRSNDTWEIVKHILSHYLPHDLRYIRVGSAGNDAGNHSLKDLLAVPDLVGGALADVLTAMDASSGIPSSGLLLPLPRQASIKSAWICDWLAARGLPLKRMTVIIRELSERELWDIKVMEFMTTKEPESLIVRP